MFQFLVNWFAPTEIFAKGVCRCDLHFDMLRGDLHIMHVVAVKNL